MNPLIRMTDIRFAYGPARSVLTGADLHVSPGERVGLLGGNGSGKSTLLHLLVGLLRPTGGTIEAFGATPRTEADFIPVRRKAALMFQDADDQLFCPTVAEDVAFAPINLGHTRDEAHAIVHRTLDAVGLSGYSDRITYKLSAGEKRMVALATVLAMAPQLLLLDEPSANLDSAARTRLVDILTTRHEAMLLVSHDLEMIRHLCTRVVRLEGGRIAEMHNAGTNDEPGV